MKGRPKTHCMRILVFMVFLSLHAQAEDALTEPVTNPESTEQNQALEQVREELTNLESRWYGLMRVRWHDTQMVSAGLGAIFVKQPENVDCSIGCSLRGWHFEVEPGLYGIQGGVGWGKLVGETGRTKRLLHTVHFGWNVRGVVLRTWGDSSLYPQSQTLVGVEGSVSIIRMNISLGFLRSLYSGPGEESGHDWIITTGFG
ncbi:MAG: hypothetical protein WBN06_04085, partial [Lysobacterales bacterium]